MNSDCFIQPASTFIYKVNVFSFFFFLNKYLLLFDWKWRRYIMLLNWSHKQIYCLLAYQIYLYILLLLLLLIIIDLQIWIGKRFSYFLNLYKKTWTVRFGKLVFFLYFCVISFLLDWKFLTLVKENSCKLFIILLIIFTEFYFNFLFIISELTTTMCFYF